MKNATKLYKSLLTLCILGWTAASCYSQTVINNDKIRVGNGSENSINFRGNMQQPFYNANDTWFKLTYSNIPLNASFAVGGDGSNEWNINGIRLHDPTMGNQVINTSGFNYNSGDSGPGTGTVVSTGTLSFSGQDIEVTKTYELLPDNSFIKVKVRLRNTSATDANNVRVWIGTRDDWVGMTDRPLKQRGNLVDGAFELIGSTSERSQAVRITSNNEGVLFFTTAPTANTLVNNCCQWVNIHSLDPANAPISHSSDGSYGFYVRMNDLAPGESDEFEWFYAAGSIDELEEIVNEVAQASGAVSDITCSTGNFEAQGTEDGIGYYIVVPQEAPEPTEAQIKAGENYGDVSVVNAGQASMTASTAHVFALSNLSHSTAYSIYFVLEDAVPQFSNVTRVNFTSQAPPTLQLTTVPSSTCALEGDGTASVAVNGGKAPYGYAWSSGEESAEITNKAAGSYDIEVSDSGGCPVVQATANIEVNDQSPPVVIARDVLCYLNADGIAEISTDMVDNGSSDDCGISHMTLSQTQFSCNAVQAPEGHTVSLTVFDEAGNSASATAQVQVVDTIAPIAAAQDLTIFLDAQGVASIDPEMAENGSTDNCSVENFQLSKTQFDCGDLGAQQLTFTASDISGNNASTTLQIEVLDILAPELEVQDIQIVLNAQGQAQIGYEAIETHAFDNCGIAQRSLSIEQFDCSHLGENHVQLTAIDGSGNETTRTAIVSVVDQSPPSLLTQDASVELDENGSVTLNAEWVQNLFDAGCTDNCGIDPNSFILDKMSLDCSDIGEHSYTLTVADMSGNTASTSVLLEVVDAHAPVAAAQDVTIFLNAEGVATLDAESVDAGSSDNCGIAARSINKQQFSCEDVGEQELFLTVSDFFGNQDQASFTLTVVDEIAPVASFVENAVVYLDAMGIATPQANALIASLEDNCAVSTTAFDVEFFNCSDVGLRQIGFTAEDVHGNVTTISTQITVADTVKPVFAISSIELELDSEGMAALDEATLMPFASDACGIAEIAIQKTDWTCEDSGSTTEIVIFDMNGNATQRSLQVNLIDTEAPSLIAEDIVLSLDASGRVNLDPSMFSFVAEDNCSIASVVLSKTRLGCEDLGETEVTITVSDPSGNSTSQTIQVQLLDEIAPTIICEDVIKVCEGSFNYLNHVVAEDNCHAELSQLVGPAPGSVLSAGEYFMQFMAEDAAGNSTIRSAVLQVQAAPEVDLGGDLEVAIGQTVELVAGNNPNYSYLWSTGATSPAISLEVTDDISISVSVSNEIGCTGVDEIYITAAFALGIADQTDLEFVIFPNPSSDRINIQFGNGQQISDAVLRITDLNGKLIHAEGIYHLGEDKRIELELGNLPQGMYLLTIQSKQGQMSKRFSKM